jgi:ribosomal protein L11 methyltransferase
VEASARNAQANGVALRCGLPDAVEGVYDTVLANILATPLKVLAPLLRARLAPGGWLVLAGILERQAQELSEAYSPYLPITVAARREGWVLMTGRVPPTQPAAS